MDDYPNSSNKKLDVPMTLNDAVTSLMLILILLAIGLSAYYLL